DADDLVAPAATVQPRQAAPGHAQHLAGLRAGRDLEPHGPLHRRHLDLGAERRLAERDRERVVEVGAFPVEAGILLDLEHDHDVPARPAPRARVALAAQREVVAGRNARRHIDGEGALDRLDAAPAALGALPLDDLALALAVRARRHAHELPQHRALHAPHLAGAAARRAPYRRRAVLRPAAAAFLARVQHLDLERLARTLRDLGHR